MFIYNYCKVSSAGL